MAKRKAPYLLVVSMLLALVLLLGLGAAAAYASPSTQDGEPPDDEAGLVDEGEDPGDEEEENGDLEDGEEEEDGDLDDQEEEGEPVDEEEEEIEEERVLETRDDNYFCGADAAYEHPAALRVADSYSGTYPISYTRVISWFCAGYGLGEIALALQTSQAISVTPEALLEARLDQGWGQIWQEYELIGRMRNAVQVGPPEHAGRPEHAGAPEGVAPPGQAGRSEEVGGRPDHAGPPEHVGSPEATRTPDERGGRPEQVGPPEHASPPEHAGPKDKTETGGNNGNGGGPPEGRGGRP